MTKQTEQLEVTVIPKDEIEKYVTGIPTERAANLKKAFAPIIDLMEEYEQEYNQIVSIDTWTPEDAKEARKLRLKYVKVRTGADNAHKEVKSDLLLQTKAIDGMRAIIRATVSGKEDQLAEIENYIENRRKEEIKAKQEERELALSDYGVTNFPETLGEMEDDQWERYFTETRNEYLKQKKAEEEAALAKERTNKILRYASYVENFDVIDFAKLSEKEFNALYESAKEKFEKAEEEMARLKAEKEEADRRAEMQAKAAEEKLREEQEKARIEQERIDQLLSFRVKSLMDVSYDGDVVKYNGKRLVTKKNLLAMDEREFEEFTTQHNEEVQEKRREQAKKEAEERRIREKEEARIKAQREEIAKQKSEMEARQKALAEAEKKREEELFEGNDDKEKLLSIARQFREQELPTFTTTEGKQVERSIRTYLSALSDKIEQKVTELFTEEEF